MQTPTPSSFDDLSKDELIEQLEAAQARNEILIRFIGSIIHEVRAPTFMVLGYANLFLKEAETAPSLSVLIKYVQGMKKTAERIQEAGNLSLAWWRMLQLLEKPPAKTKIILADLNRFEQVAGVPIKTDLTQISPILANEEVIIAIMESLRFRKSDEAELVIREDGEYVHFTLSNGTNLSYWVDKYLKNENGRLVCDEQKSIFEPICVIVTLVEKYGGAVFAELSSNSTYSLSFTLPVYQEAA